MATINLTVYGHEITCTNEEKPVLSQGSHNIDTVIFTYDSTYSGYTLYATMYQSMSDPVLVELSNNSCKIPIDALLYPGKVRIGLRAEDSLGSVIATSCLEWFNVEPGAIDGSEGTSTSGIASLTNRIAALESAISGGSVLTEVRQALFTLLNNAIYRDTDLEDEKSIIQSWASAVTSISLNHKSITLNSVQIVLLEAVTVPSNVPVTWTSSNPSVATVNDGAVAPVSNGQCVITATAGDMTAICSVSVGAFASVTSINAVYSQKGYVFNVDTLNSLKSNLAVTASYSDGTSRTVNDYALSGTLEEGTSEITVVYKNKTTAFSVNVSTLPTGYTKYDYVRNKAYGSSNKTIIIDTKLGGGYCETRYEHEIEMAITARHVAEGSGSSFYCKRNAAGSVVASRSIWNSSGTKYNVQFCDRSIGTDSDVNANIEVPLGQKVNIITSRDKVYKDGDLYCTVNNDTFTSINSSYTTYGIPLFGQVTGNTWYGTGDEGKIYKFAVKDLDTDEYVAYLVACTNPGGNAGFYDMIRQTFYTSSTPANLECGND